MEKLILNKLFVNDPLTSPTVYDLDSYKDLVYSLREDGVTVKDNYLDDEDDQFFMQPFNVELLSDEGLFNLIKKAGMLYDDCDISDTPTYFKGLEENVGVILTHPTMSQEIVLEMLGEKSTSKEFKGAEFVLYEGVDYNEAFFIVNPESLGIIASDNSQCGVILHNTLGVLRSLISVH